MIFAHIAAGRLAWPCGECGRVALYVTRKQLRRVRLRAEARRRFDPPRCALCALAASRQAAGGVAEVEQATGAGHGARG